VEWAASMMRTGCADAASPHLTNITAALSGALTIAVAWQQAMKALDDGISEDVALPISLLSAALGGRQLLSGLKVEALAHDVSSADLGFLLVDGLTLAGQASQFIGEEAVLGVEPALLVRFFCASAATALLHRRMLLTAWQIGWLRGMLSSEEPAFAAIGSAAKLTELRVSADFLRPRPDVRALPMPPPLPHARSRDVLASARSQHSGVLLVLNLPVNMQNDHAMDYAEEIEAHLPCPGVHILLLEAWGVVVSPRVAHRFHAHGEIEIVHQPHFGLHVTDQTVLAVMPSLMRLRCSEAKLCWWLDLENASPVRSAAVSSVAGRADAPREPGCWFRLPSGCRREQSLPVAQWQRDSYGEREFRAKVDSDACLRRRGRAFNGWCGTDDIEMHFVPRASFKSEAMPEPRHASLGEVLVKAVSAAHEIAAAVAGNMLPPDAPPAPKGVIPFDADCAEIADGCDVLHRRRLESLRGLQTAFQPWQGWGPYLQRHRSPADPAARMVIWACHPSFPCGGHGDRVKGIVSAFVLALLTDRLFYVDAPDPWDLRLFLEPQFLDWRISGLHGTPCGRHVLWDHDLFERSYLDELLVNSDPIWVIYTNKQSIVGPLLGHPELAGRASSLGLFQIPYLVHHIWSTLFRPTVALERCFAALRGQLGGPDAPYIAMHHRAGDHSSGFGSVNGETDRRGHVAEVVALLTCAHFIEHRLGLPNSTRWYLAADSAEALKVPQVEVWRKAGKLLTRGPGRRTHLAAAGVVPPSGSKGLSAVGSSPFAEPPEALLAAESLAGVADAWVDFLALSRAAASVVSSSAFGIMAAQIGGLENTFYVNGCVRLDLVA